jgi:hypothetical protein
MNKSLYGKGISIKAALEMYVGAIIFAGGLSWFIAAVHQFPNLNRSAQAIESRAC